MYGFPSITTLLVFIACHHCSYFTAFVDPNLQLHLKFYLINIVTLRGRIKEAARTLN